MEWGMDWYVAVQIGQHDGVHVQNSLALWTRDDKRTIRGIAGVEIAYCACTLADSIFSWQKREKHYIVISTTSCEHLTLFREFRSNFRQIKNSFVIAVTKMSTV